MPSPQKIDTLTLSKRAIEAVRKINLGHALYAIKCTNCQSQSWTLFFNTETSELIAGCAKCERPVKLQIELTA